MNTADPFDSIVLDSDEKDRAKSYSSYKQLHIRLPFLSLIIGIRGSRKTCTMINLLKSLKAFDRYYFCVKDKEERLYQELFGKMKYIESVLKRKIFVILNSPEELERIKFNKKYNNVLVMDDFVNMQRECWRIVADFCLVYARHNNVSVIFITQSFFDVPIKIRKNVDVGVLKSINNQQEAKTICRNWNSTDIDNKLLYRIQREVVKNPLSSMIYNLNPNVAEKWKITVDGTPVLEWLKEHEKNKIKDNK